MNRDPDRMAFLSFCLVSIIAIPAAVITTERFASAVVLGIVCALLAYLIDSPECKE